MSRTMRAWILEGHGYDNLNLVNDVPVPAVGERDVLIKLKAAALNYRDTNILHDEYPFPTLPKLSPLSDGAGIVEAVGSQVTRFKVGDKVMPIFNQGHIDGPITPAIQSTGGLGGPHDGVLREYAAFCEDSVSRIPEGYSFEQAASLVCAAVTAWNALFGLDSKRTEPGDWVLTQGTGGVSLFAVQIAKAAGARVVATTSSDDKFKLLRSLGADHVINYRENLKWGKTAKDLTGGIGFKNIVEVGGTGTLRQSVEAVQMDGVINVIGYLGKSDDAPSMLDALLYTCNVRGILIGSRAQLEALTRAIEANKIEPVIDKVFDFEQAKEAYKHLESQKHVGKVVIKIQ